MMSRLNGRSGRECTTDLAAAAKRPDCVDRDETSHDGQVTRRAASKGFAPLWRPFDIEESHRCIRVRRP